LANFQKGQICQIAALELQLAGFDPSQTTTHRIQHTHIHLLNSFSTFSRKIPPPVNLEYYFATLCETTDVED
jgi:hypothetical protein